MSAHHLNICLKLFAVYQEAVGCAELRQQVAPGTTVGQVLDQLLADYPQLAPWRSVTRLGVNLQFADAETPLADGDEVVLIPPVSGG
jgi:sulfur-carrier protein